MHVMVHRPITRNRRRAITQRRRTMGAQSSQHRSITAHGRNGAITIMVITSAAVTIATGVKRVSYISWNDLRKRL